jgi:hypothetical protein
MDSTPDRPAANTSSPVLVLLPGLDGTGKLFAEFLRVLDLNISTLVVAYPKDVPMNYDELETLVTAALPTDRPFVLLGESFSGPAAVAASVAADPSAGMRGRRAVFYAPGLGRQDFEQPGRPWPARYSD